MDILPICELWFSNDAAEWNAALHRYWDAASVSRNVALEQSMERLDRERIRQMSPDEWFEFLHDEYFRWKYTAANRYATTTSFLRRKGGTQVGRQELHQIRANILDINPANIRAAIDITKLPGLGTAGVSGLLSLLYPEAFGTVDQFVVKALREVLNLQEASAIARMNPEGLTSRDGEILIKIMRRQSVVLTHSLGALWRPRDVDKVLWTYGRGPSNTKIG